MPRPYQEGCRRRNPPSQLYNSWRDAGSANAAWRNCSAALAKSRPTSKRHASSAGGRLPAQGDFQSRATPKARPFAAWLQFVYRALVQDVEMRSGRQRSVEIPFRELAGPARGPGPAPAEPPPRRIQSQGACHGRVNSALTLATGDRRSRRQPVPACCWIMLRTGRAAPAAVRASPPAIGLGEDAPRGSEAVLP